MRRALVKVAPSPCRTMLIRDTAWSERCADKTPLMQAEIASQQGPYSMHPNGISDVRVNTRQGTAKRVTGTGCRFGRGHLPSCKCLLGIPLPSDSHLFAT